MSILHQNEMYRKFAGVTSSIFSEIEHIFNEMLCDYFFGSNRRRKNFTYYLLSGDKLSFMNKAACVKDMAWEIEHENNAMTYEKYINHAISFNRYYNLSHYGAKCFNNNSRKVEIEEYLRPDRSIHTEITDEYIIKVQDEGFTVVYNLKEAQRILSESLSPTRGERNKHNNAN